MRKIIVGLFLVAGSFLASAQQQQGTQQGQSRAKPAWANTDSSVPRGSHDSAVPSPDKYPFAEALKRLQGDNAGQSAGSQPSRVPPLTIGPAPTVGPKSKQVPRDYVVKRDVALNQTGQDAVAVSSHASLR